MAKQHILSTDSDLSYFHIKNISQEKLKCLQNESNLGKQKNFNLAISISHPLFEEYLNKSENILKYPETKEKGKLCNLWLQLLKFLAKSDPLIRNPKTKKIPIMKMKHPKNEYVDDILAKAKKKIKKL